MHESSTNRTRILLVVPTLRVGGAEKQVALLAARLDRTRFEPLVVALTSGGPLEESLEQQGVRYRILGPAKSMGSPRLSRLRHPICFRRFLVLVHTFRPDVIHAFLPVSNIYAALSIKLSRVGPRLIVSKRALGLYKTSHPLLACAERWANGVADVIHVNSRAVEQDVLVRERPSGSRLRLIYNGVETEYLETHAEQVALRKAWDIPGDARMVVTIGNLNPRKGLEELVTAAGQIVADCPPTHWVIVGRDDGMGTALRAQIDEASLSDRIHLAGPREDVGRVLAAADLVVHPSRQEGFSNVILEAMAAGRPLIVTDVGGNAEAVIHEESGLVVPPCDPTALAQAMQRLLRDPEECNRLGAAARERAVKMFGMADMIRETAELYEGLVEDGGRVMRA